MTNAIIDQAINSQYQITPNTGKIISSPDTGIWTIQSADKRLSTPYSDTYPAKPYINVNLKSLDGTIITASRWAGEDTWRLDTILTRHGESFSYGPNERPLDPKISQALDKSIEDTSYMIAKHKSGTMRGERNYPEDRATSIAACQEGLGTGTAMGHPSPQPAQTTPNIQPTPQPQLTI